MRGELEAKMILASQKIIKEWTEKGAGGTKTLINYFKENVNKYPDKIRIMDPLNKEKLVGFEPERLTYREFDKAVDAVAERFLEVGT